MPYQPAEQLLITELLKQLGNKSALYADPFVLFWAATRLADAQLMMVVLVRRDVVRTRSQKEDL